MNKGEAPSSDRFADHEGPTEDERTEALRMMRVRNGHSGNTFGMHAIPRKSKFGRAQRVGNVRVR